MKKMKMLFASLFFSLPLIGNDVYDSVELLPFDPTGSFAAVNSLDRVFNDNEIKTIIEVGSWAGVSTRFFAMRIAEKGGVVYAVDHWHGTPGQRGEMTDTRLSYIYHLFLSNIRNAGLTEYVIPMRMKSLEAAKALDAKVDLIYLDAARDQKSVYESIMAWISHLRPEGKICGSEWREREVRDGVQRAANKLGKQVEYDSKGYFWIFK